MKDAQTTLTIYMMMVVAIATTFNAIVPPILASRRDKRLSKATKEVASEIATHRNADQQSFGLLQEKVDATQEKVDATHIIVNAQKTAMMKKLSDAQLAILTMTQALLEDKPNSKRLQQAVTRAQALYDESLKDLDKKEDEPKV